VIIAPGGPVRRLEPLRHGRSRHVPLQHAGHQVISRRRHRTHCDRDHPGAHGVAYDGGGRGKGGDVTLYYDGKEVGKGDVGYESGTTVSRDYTAHTNRGNGKINWVQIDLGKDAEDADHYIDPDERFRIAMARQ
jgi:hypothetical protein